VRGAGGLDARARNRKGFPPATPARCERGKEGMVAAKEMGSGGGGGGVPSAHAGTAAWGLAACVGRREGEEGLVDNDEQRLIRRHHLLHGYAVALSRRSCIA
jgi:hypothetical protein